MIHFRFKFPKIGAQSGIELSPMGDRGCGGVLGGNANVTNTPPHVRGPMGNMGRETQPEMRLGARGINSNPFGLGGLNAGWVFWGIRRTRGQVGFDAGRMKTSPAGLWCI